MDTFSNFNENSKLAHAKNDLLSAENFEAYIAEHGSERFEGYKDAVIQILGFIHDNILMAKAPYKSLVNPNMTNIFLEQNSSQVKKQLIQFYNERIQFLENVIDRNHLSNDFEVPKLV